MNAVVFLDLKKAFDTSSRYSFIKEYGVKGATPAAGVVNCTPLIFFCGVRNVLQRL